MPTLATFNACQLSHRADEDYINKSLLDSLDEQADSEPISSSESDHAAPHSYGSSSSSSSGSPTAPYHYSQHPQLSTRPESPTNNYSLHSSSMSSNQDPMYTMTNSQNGIFPNMMHSNNFDYIPPEMDPSKHQLSNQAKLNGYETNGYRSLSSYNPLRQRHYPGHSVVSSTLRENYYQNPSNDMLGMTSPIQSHAPLAFDFGSGQAAHNYKQFHETFGHQNSSHTLTGLNGKSNVAHIASNKGFTSQYSAGVQLSSQTPFGPHVPLNMPSHIPNGLNNVTANPSQNTSNPSAAVSGNSVPSGQEEICTIFVVGFPDDMQASNYHYPLSQV